ncbi:hypothetical protein RUM44_006271 [Polyplax serrata]|uniref:Cytosine-specific methyltransferase n=1 Tax=Polyplax serrata TaxID=468196 RepID=A0ABR1AHN1_POLSC
MSKINCVTDSCFASESCDWTGFGDETTEKPVIKKRKLSEDDDRSVAICQVCRQNVLDPRTKLFQGLPDGALEEEAALTDDRLQLYSNGGFMPEIDIKPLHKVTHFSVFDGEGHLCPFDTGLIENDELIFFSGYIKPIYDDDPSPSGGVPAQELGPIVEWWISGFDCGNSFLIAFRSPYAEYILMEPSPDYSNFMRMPKQKALLTKIVIEFLSNSSKPTYDELVSRINEVSVPEDIEPFNSESLCSHAQFIVDQVREVDSNRKLVSTPAIQEIIKRFKVSPQAVGSSKKVQSFKTVFNTTTTPLVRRKFKFFFEGDGGAEGKRDKKNLTVTSSPLKLSKFIWEQHSNFAIVNDEKVFLKDFVLIHTNQPEKEGRIFRVEKFFQQNFTKQVHCTEFIKGRETILGNASESAEVFYLEECSDWPICKITKKVNVAVEPAPRTWEEFRQYRGGSSKNEMYVRQKYSFVHATFEDFNDPEGFGCDSCDRKLQKERAGVYLPINGRIDESGVMVYEKIIRGKEEFLPGYCVFLEPFAVVFDAQKSSQRIEKTLVTFKADEVIYPEIYRKSKEISLSEECPEPFVIGRINSIFSRNEGPQKKFFLSINKFYRPEDTRIIKPGDKRLLDTRLLYWSKEVAEVSFDHVRGGCDVIYSEVAPDVTLHSHQFYFNSVFDSESETFYVAKDVVIKNRERVMATKKKLKTLNAFSGCGGLAEGLRQSGTADILWAVEMDKPTAKAYKLNFPSIVMFEKDCNLFLKEVLSGVSADENGTVYPGKGDVELLCGGPPCQGFSTMNRFTTKEESQYNNSLILTYLSFCDYYRPKFFVMENVRNFVSFKKSIFLKHTLACLIAMGYQCSFAVLQVGNYGLPQTRRRLFIVAAAPGFQLPYFPKPSNVFYGSLKNSECEVSGVTYMARFSKIVAGSAPFRNVTINDAIHDLPPILQGTCEPPACQSSKTSYQKFLLGSIPLNIQDHITKEISPINEARIKHIPAAKGCDWRDLPNIQVLLRDGTLTNLLIYSHHDRKNGKSCCGQLRGVCSCASGKPCNSKDRQTNTLIPWFLVHTANRNNNWTGLYGRLDWQGVFNTVTTNPEPSNQQGKVLHPKEDRIISVRECARAQGMPDSFKFCGTVADKFRQVGNAVPPPVARALGYEIHKSLARALDYSI